MINTNDFDFSFSGLKTSVLYKFQKETRQITDEIIREYCNAFENSVCEVLSKKIIKACQKYNVKNIILGGGVSANSSIRDRISDEAKKIGAKTYFPEKKHTGDNAAMIAIAGYFNRDKKKKNNFTITADPNLKL
jgi:N6-L-threonylcarbamoyladenine synthase